MLRAMQSLGSRQHHRRPSVGEDAPSFGGRAGRRALASDARGEVFIEYLIVLGTIGVVAAYAFASVGPLVVRNYTNTRGVLLSINP